MHQQSLRSGIARNCTLLGVTTNEDHIPQLDVK